SANRLRRADDQRKSAQNVAELCEVLSGHGALTARRRLFGKRSGSRARGAVTQPICARFGGLCAREWLPVFARYVRGYGRRFLSLGGIEAGVLVCHQTHLGSAEAEVFGVIGGQGAIPLRFSLLLSLFSSL